MASPDPRPQAEEAPVPVASGDGVKAPARSRAPRKRAAPAPAAAAAPPLPPVLVDWSDAEVEQVRAELHAQAEQLRGEIGEAERSAAALQRDTVGEGSGDEADAGSKTFEREHEMSLSNNSRDLLHQVQRALARLEDGSYGRCERCGETIPKPRLQAFPRATLCVSCKQREERR